MANFRIETGFDPASGKYYAKLFYPQDAARPVATTASIYDSDREAMTRIREMFSDVLDPPAESPRPPQVSS